MSVTNQWGKRLSTDAPIAEPDAQRRRLDARTLQDSLSVKSRAARRSPFDTLPGEVIRHLC